MHCTFTSTFRTGQWAVEEAMGAHGMINYVDARTSWMDGLVRAAAAQGCGQVVIIASGYCTRAYRLHQPGAKACALTAGPQVLGMGFWVFLS